MDLENNKEDMVMGRNLWGEITETKEEEILRTAQEATKRKGYSSYSDFGEFIQRIVQKAEPSLAGRAVQMAEKVIRDNLKEHGWIRKTGERREVVFYPPDSPLLKSDQLTLEIDNSDGNDSHRIIVHPPN